MDELISKEVVIDTLKAVRDLVWEVDIPSPTVPEYIEHHEQMQSIMRNIDILTEKIIKMPSAQPQQRWIPVTERLPDVGQWVLCQCRAKIMDVLRLTDDDRWYRKPDTMYMGGFVLAWMPLPEPYQEGEQNG